MLSCVSGQCHAHVFFAVSKEQEDAEREKLTAWHREIESNEKANERAAGQVLLYVCVFVCLCVCMCIIVCACTCMCACMPGVVHECSRARARVCVGVFACVS